MMALVEGSDCVTGKIQYATKHTAQNAARAGRVIKGRPTLHAYRCDWCSCWHIGNAHGQNSRSRRR